MLNVGSMGRDIQPPQDLLFWGGCLIHFTGLVFPGSPGMSIFFWGIPFIETLFSGGWVAEKHIILGKWNL